MVTLNISPVPGGITLELIMRDTQLGLTDAASYFAFQPNDSHLEILSIESPRPLSTSSSDNVVNMVVARSHDIVTFLIRRETGLLAQYTRPV